MENRIIMDREDKKLLTGYLCEALPFGIIVNCTDGDVVLNSVDFEMGFDKPEFWHGTEAGNDLDVELDNVKPYLRPMHSMTESEYNEMFGHFYAAEQEASYDDAQSYYGACISAGDLAKRKWLLENHFDFLGLIKKNLAIAVTKENNPYNK